MFSVVNPERAKNLVWNFHNEEQLAKKSVSVTYPAADLKAFVDQCITDGNPYVRVYFGQYGQNIIPIQGRAAWNGHKTVVFVPVDDQGEDNYTPHLFIPPYDEGQICPPPDPCPKNDLYNDTTDINFDHTIQH